MAALAQISAVLFTYTWVLGTASSGDAVECPVAALAASIQFSGNFGNATAWLEGSNDGVTWLPALDNSGAFIEATEVPQLFEVSTAARYLRVSTDGSGSDAAISASLVVWRS